MQDKTMLVSPPSLGAVMISCSARDAIREETLIEWELFGRLPLTVVMDHEICLPAMERPQNRQEHTALGALKRGFDAGWEYLLFLEDDLEFNVYFRENLLHWEPLERGELTFGSLYNPNVAGPSVLDPGSDRRASYRANPDRVYGSQAFVLSRTCAQFCIEHWWEVEGMQDIKMAGLARQLGVIYYHAPSLVQHTGVKSVWTTENRFHTAPDFDPHWRWDD